MRSISSKLILAFLGVGLVAIAIIVLITRWNTSTEFKKFVDTQRRTDLATQLTNYYSKHGSWDNIAESFAFPPPRQNPGGPPPDQNQKRRDYPFTLTDPNGKVILNRPGFQIGQILPASELQVATKLEVDGVIVGYLLSGRSFFGDNPMDNLFIERINFTLLVSGLGAVTMALLLGIFLSRTMTKPIRELTAATRAVSNGYFGQQVSVRSRDELGELAHSFNQMSSDLERSINARKQMTVDIAHELRTPLSLILGHAEAVHDGVLPPTSENFEIIREEAGRLEKLVDDLRTLSLADAGELSLELQLIPPEKLLREVVDLYRYKSIPKKITVNLDIPDTLPLIHADSGRLTQVLTNILDNAFRHTPEGGNIGLAVKSDQSNVEISIQDNGQGIAETEVEHIFDRFYRADKSRQRDDSGSGLGLAIAKSIVQAHNGQIFAESKIGQGLRIVIQLPF